MRARRGPCAYCQKDLGRGRFYQCQACRSKLHLSCIDELKRCPALDCGFAFTREPEVEVDSYRFEGWMMVLGIPLALIFGLLGAVFPAQASIVSAGALGRLVISGLGLVGLFMSYFIISYLVTDIFGLRRLEVVRRGSDTVLGLLMSTFASWFLGTLVVMFQGGGMALLWTSLLGALLGFFSNAKAEAENGRPEEEGEVLSFTGRIEASPESD